MAWIKGFPNDSTQVLDVPMFVPTLTDGDLATDTYVGMPIGATVLTASLNAADGAWILKVTNVNGNEGDWVFLSEGGNIGAGL